MRCLVVGPAKSGTTALLTLIARALDAPSLFVEEPLETVLPAMRSHPNDSVAKVIFTHEREAAIVQSAEAFDRRVLLWRDPRDVLVSSALYSLANQTSKLRDDAFLHRFLALVRAKQADPTSVHFCDIARLLDNGEEAFIDHVLRQQAEFTRFRDHAGTNWHLLRYEDFVAGKLAALSDYLGLSLNPAVKVAPEYARVERTRSAGDWRHWFTPRDVATLQPICDPLLECLGYPISWPLAPSPRIAPEHSWRYLERLIDERRRHHEHPPRTVASTDTRTCNLCGGTAFGPGPADRMATNGSPPRCLGCGALERQRIMRRVLQALPLGFLDWRRVLQFSRDNGLPQTVFPHVDTRAEIGETGLHSLAYGDTDIDLVVFSHLFEYVQDDLGDFAQLVARLSPRGFMLASFASPWSRESTLESTPASGTSPLRLYGQDLAQHFRCAEAGLTVLAVEGADPCTDTKEVIYLFFKNSADAVRVRRWLQDIGEELRLSFDVQAPGTVRAISSLPANRK